MKKKKETLLDKFVKKDYNNELEEVLSKKKYQEEVKSLLLDILYKIDNSYKDYETVKKNVLPKDEYIQGIIKTVEKNCDIIEFVKPNKDNKKAIRVDKQNKVIECYPIVRKLLYCLSKIQKTGEIIKIEPDIINRALTNTINIGNNINTVEPLRDFNGYSWNISVLDIENFEYNLIYQDLIMLLDNRILEDWANRYDGMIDYMDLFKDYLDEKYGKKLSKDILESLKKVSVLLSVQTDEAFKDEAIIRKNDIEEQLGTMENRAKYIEDICSHKKQLEKDIRRIDIVLNDEDELSVEYTERNRDLPLEQKIFSKRILRIKLEQEREEKLSELKVYNQKMYSENFLNTYHGLEYEQKYLEHIEEKNINKYIQNELMNLQKHILQVFKIKIKNAQNKEELMKIIYEIRYFNLIPLSTTQNIGNSKKLQKLLDEVKDEAIQKAIELKIINNICNDVEKNKKILEKIFIIKIIKLEDVYLKITKGKDDVLYIQFFDETIEDDRIPIDFDLTKEDLKIKLNKKIKLFE